MTKPDLYSFLLTRVHPKTTIKKPKLSTFFFVMVIFTTFSSVNLQAQQGNPFLRTGTPPAARGSGGPATEVLQEPRATSLNTTSSESAQISLGQRVYEFQVSLTRQIGTIITDIREGKNPLLVLTLFGIALLYGIIHTIGPGHRKTVLIGWIVTRRPGITSIGFASFLLGIFHLLGTALIVLLAVALRSFLGGTMMEARDPLQIWASIGSGAVVVVLGVYLLISVFHHDHDHDKQSHHENSSDGQKSNQSLLMVAFSMGFVPCPGSMSILVVSFLIGDLLIGMGTLIAISIGTILTLFVFGISIRFLIGKIESLGRNSKRASQIIQTGLKVFQAGAATLVLVYGLLWSVGGMFRILA